MSTQMLSYHLKKQLYPGNEKIQVVTSMTRTGQAQSSKKRKGPVATKLQVKKAKRYGASRLCGEIDKLCNHVSHIRSVKKLLVCVWCELPTYSIYGKCKYGKGKPIPLHYNLKGPKTKGSLCFYHYHNDSYFGLGKNDGSIFLGMKRSGWLLLDKYDMEENASHISNLVDDAGY